VTLELGGKSPNIFFADVAVAHDAFYDKTLEGFTMFALNQGEVCTCPSRADPAQLPLLPRARGVRRLQAVRHRPGEPPDDARPLPADQEAAGELLGQRARLLLMEPAGEFRTGDSDVRLGDLHLEGLPEPVPVWMSAAQFEYWRHTHLTIDVVPGRGSGFSLEAPEGVRFLIRSRLLTEDELDSLDRSAR
jgi:uncharacterized protein (DUF779 family)